MILPVPGSSGSAWPVTLTEAKAETNISSSVDDDELQAKIDAATAILENHPLYTIKDHVSSATWTEWADGGNEQIVLKHYPVLSVASVAEYTPAAQVIAAEPTDTTATFTGYGYTIDTDSGILTRTSSGLPTTWTDGRVKIVYTAGVTTVPADIREAALQLIEHLWQTQRGGQGTGVPAGLDAQDYTAETGGIAYNLPNRVVELLEPYRKTPAIA